MVGEVPRAVRSRSRAGPLIGPRLRAARRSAGLTLDALHTWRNASSTAACEVLWTLAPAP